MTTSVTFPDRSEFRYVTDYATGTEHTAEYGYSHDLQQLTPSLISGMSLESLYEIVEREYGWLSRPAVREHLTRHHRSNLERLAARILKRDRNQTDSLTSQ